MTLRSTLAEQPVLHWSDALASTDNATEQESALRHFSYFFNAAQANTENHKNAIFRLRHAVYCEELQFEPVRETGMEQDEFDYRALHCFINHVASDNLAGTVRLITALNDTDKLPIEHHFENSISTTVLAPHFFERNSICEISRLAVPASIRRRTPLITTKHTPLSYLLNKLETRCCSVVSVALYLIATLMCVHSGRYHAYVMIEPALARILRRVGINFQQIGEVIEFNGKRAPYYVDMRTVTETLKPAYLALREVLAEQLGIGRSTGTVTPINRHRAADIERFEEVYQPTPVPAYA